MYVFVYPEFAARLTVLQRIALFGTLLFLHAKVKMLKLAKIQLVYIHTKSGQKKISLCH